MFHKNGSAALSTPARSLRNATHLINRSSTPESAVERPPAISSAARRFQRARFSRQQTTRTTAQRRFATVASGTPGETGIVPTGCLKKKSAMAAGVGLRRRARLGLPSTLSPFRGLRSGREKCRPLDRGCSRPARRCRHALPISGSAGSRGSWGSRNAVRDVGHLDHA